MLFEVVAIGTIHAATTNLPKLHLVSTETKFPYQTWLGPFAESWIGGAIRENATPADKLSKFRSAATLSTGQNGFLERLLQEIAASKSRPSR